MNSLKNSTFLKQVFRWLPVILWCAFIFYQSAKTGAESDQMSMGVVLALNHLVEKLIGVDKLQVTDFLVRKAAHFTEYLILGALLYRAFIKETGNWRAFILSVMSGIVYAASDELHQAIIPGRGPSVRDVFIDASGVLSGTLVLYFWIRKLRKNGKKIST